MIEKQPFGNTGHMSSRVIFGSVALKWTDQDEADRALDLLLHYGVNHIDTAPVYGDSELRIGPWMKKHRNDFFLATKISTGLYSGAREQFYRSLERLQTDHVQLLQFHNLTDVGMRELVFNEGGALRLLEEAKAQGLAGAIGITGHGLRAPELLMLSLKAAQFDSVLLPYNYLLMKDPEYKSSFDQLFEYCRTNNIAVQTMKSAARGLWNGKHKDHVTWYEPLNTQEAVTKAVHWAMAKDYIFLNSTGDLDVLPMVLKAADSFDGTPPPEEEMQKLVTDEKMVSIFY